MPHRSELKPRVNILRASIAFIEPAIGRFGDRRRRDREAWTSVDGPLVVSLSNEPSSMTQNPGPKLSARARKLLAEPPMPEYFQEHAARNDTPYHPDVRPDGYICLSVAENELMVGSLLERLAKVSAPPASVLGYGPMIGAVEFRERLAGFLGRCVFGRRFLPEQLAVLAGAGSVLEILFHNLCDPGDGVLVPTPSYAGFWADLETRDELQIVPVHTSYEDGFEVTPELLDAALESASVPVRALLFTTPNNPLGRVYEPHEVTAVMEWAESRGVHLVLDEIYALSVFGERKFTSGASLRCPWVITCTLFGRSARTSARAVCGAACW